MSDIRTLVRSTYDLQKIRIQMGNRIAGQFKVKLGQAPGTSEIMLEQEAKNILKALRLSYDRITDGLVLNKRWSKVQFKSDGIIDTITELALVAQYLEIDATEKRQFNRFEDLLFQYPIYTEFLEKTRGCGPAMSGVLISEINIHKAKYPSSIWQYAGLDVKTDGRGASMRTEHLIDREYKAKDGTMKTRKSITFNPFLKTKLMGVLAGSFLKSGNEKYTKIYHDYKTRLENHPKWMEVSRGHRHMAAMRYMVKLFIVDLYREWRTLEGLPVSLTYQEAKLGHVHGVQGVGLNPDEDEPGEYRDTEFYADGTGHVDSHGVDSHGA